MLPNANWQQIQSIMEQYHSWAEFNGETNASPEPEKPTFVVTAATTKGISILQSLIDHAPNEFQLFTAQSAQPVPSTPSPAPSRTLTGKKVFIDVGHGITGDQTYDPGAIGPAGEHEHKLNMLQAQEAKLYLESLGCDVTLGLYTRRGEGICLEERGKRAKGSHLREHREPCPQKRTGGTARWRSRPLSACQWPIQITDS